jgi:hypothetical protein
MGKDGSSKAAAVAAAPAKEQKEGLGETLFDPGEQAKVEYVFLNKHLSYFAKLSQQVSPTENNVIASSLSTALGVTGLTHVRSYLLRQYRFGRRYGLSNSRT